MGSTHTHLVLPDSLTISPSHQAPLSPISSNLIQFPQSSYIPSAQVSSLSQHSGTVDSSGVSPQPQLSGFTQQGHITQVPSNS